jgi:hypothetical protein
VRNRDGALAGFACIGTARRPMSNRTGVQWCINPRCRRRRARAAARELVALLPQVPRVPPLAGLRRWFLFLFSWGLRPRLLQWRRLRGSEPSSRPPRHRRSALAVSIAGLETCSRHPPGPRELIAWAYFVERSEAEWNARAMKFAFTRSAGRTKACRSSVCRLVRFGSPIFVDVRLSRQPACLVHFSGS